MKKYFRCVCALLIAAVLVVGLVSCMTPAGQVEPTVVPPVEMTLQGLGRRPLAPCLSHCNLEALQADKWAVLVDLSDNVNFPHYKTHHIVLKNLRTVGNLSGAVRWRYDVGVVTAVTTVTTDIEWVHGAPIYRSMYFNEMWWPPEHGLSLEVRNATLENVATNSVTATAVITSGTLISTCWVVTGVLPAVGDLILFMDEISDTATFDFVIDVGYDVE